MLESSRIPQRLQRLPQCAEVVADHFEHKPTHRWGQVRCYVFCQIDSLEDVSSPGIHDPEVADYPLHSLHLEAVRDIAVHPPPQRRPQLVYGIRPNSLAHGDSEHGDIGHGKIVHAHHRQRVVHPPLDQCQIEIEALAFTWGGEQPLWEGDIGSDRSGLE